MNKTLKVLVGVYLVVSLLLILRIYCVGKQQDRDSVQYQQVIESLNDSIETLNEKVNEYKDSIKIIELERENIREQIKVVFKENEKIDSNIAVGDWDYNLKFLTDFLSSEDSISE